MVGKGARPFFCILWQHRRGMITPYPTLTESMCDKRDTSGASPFGRIRCSVLDPVIWCQRTEAGILTKTQIVAVAILYEVTASDFATW